MLCGGISFLIISRLQTHTIKTYCCSCRLGKGFFFIPTLLVLIVWRNWFWFSSPHTHNWLANIVILSFHAFFGNICCFLIEQCNKSPIHQTFPHIQLPDDPARKEKKKKTYELIQKWLTISLASENWNFPFGYSILNISFHFDWSDWSRGQYRYQPVF